MVCFLENNSIAMSGVKNNMSNKQLKARLSQELTFLKNVFTVLSLPSQMKDEEDDLLNDETSNEAVDNGDNKEIQRARSIVELEEKLAKIKSQNKFNLKSKLVKKSLSSKLNKKIKKRERNNKTKPKPNNDDKANDSNENGDVKEIKEEKKPKLEKVNAHAKPIFNTDGKLVFSKFDFSNVGHKKIEKKIGERDPKKILENLKLQEEKLKKMEENDDKNKVKEVKEKIAWKNILQKAEGQKVKDDPVLLKKSIKKMEQKKKHSKKQWDGRVQKVEEKKEARQKKRKENISKKKKEKKTKIVKAAVKRGRVVI